MGDNLKTSSIKRPEFIIFTDKDGTINLDDKKLKRILAMTTIKGSMIIPVTGRTVGDIKKQFEERSLILPKIIVGDNGANIYFTNKDEFVLKIPLDKKQVSNLISHFIQIGGNPDLIRYTDGKSIFASENGDVKEYYQGSSIAQLSKDMVETILNSDDITKITLAGSKAQMTEMTQYADGLNFHTDMDVTTFPSEEYENYRLDIASSDVSKGKSISRIIKAIRPRYGYMSIGNGYNDLSMFRQTLEDGMTVAVMGDASDELQEQIYAYEKEIKDKGKVIKVPAGRNKANNLILQVATEMQQRAKEERRKNIRGKKIKRYMDEGR